MAESTFENLCKKDFPQVFDLMTKSFPATEYRTFEKQYALLENPHYKITVQKNNNNIIAFIAVWSLDGFDFVEHFAVEPSQRGSGIGSDFLKKYLSKTKRSTVLEVENKNDELSHRRIRFYERLGFVLSHMTYIQPTLSGETHVIPLRLMCYNYTQDINQAKNEIFKKIYTKDMEN